MAGQGSQSKLGIKVETTPSVGVEPDSTMPFVSESFSAPRSLIESETIGGDGMVDNVVPGDSESSGSIAQEFDAETSGMLLWLWNGDNGYTDGSAITTGQITAAPTGSATGSDGDFTAGDYIYYACPVWTHNWLSKKWIMPKSAASSAITVGAANHVALAWTNPTGLTFADHTYAGTAIYRSTVDGAASTATFVHFVSGTGATWNDLGGNNASTPDPDVAPVPNTSRYKHTLVGAAAATGQDRLKYFSVQISKNVSDDERYFGNKVNDFALDIGGRGEIVKLTVNTLGDDRETVEGEFAASAPSIRRQILGRDAALVISGSKNCDIQSFSLNGNNNCERQGTFCGNSIAEGKRNVSGQFTLLFKDRDLYNKATQSEEIDMQLYMYGEPLVTSGSTLSLSEHGVDAIPFPRISKVDWQRVAIGEFTNPVEGPGQIIASATWQALRDSVAATDMKIELWNTQATYS